MNVLIQHIPHAVPVVVIWGIMLRFWLVQRRLQHDEDDSPPAATLPVSASSCASGTARAAPAVRRSVALRGLLALGPLLGALATGLVVYALNLGRGEAGAAAVWTHVGISLLALLLVAYKIADIGLARLRQRVTAHGAWRSGGSLVLLVLWVPLLISGVALVIWPSTASFTAYAHLIASVWWTGLLLWHLRRYLARATRAALARNQAGRLATAPAASGSPGRSRGPKPAGGPGRAATARHRGSAAGQRTPSARAAQSLPQEISDAPAWGQSSASEPRAPESPGVRAPVR